MNLKGVVCALAVAVASAGCSEDRPVSGAPAWGDDGRWWASDAGDTGDSDDLGDARDSGDSAEPSGGADVVSPKMPDDMAALVVNVRRVLTASCAPCHSGREGVAAGGFGEIFDVEAMVAARLVVPGEPEASPLYTRTVDGEMPPGLVEEETNAGPRFEGGAPDPFSGELIGYVEPEDASHLRRWISRGAPPLRPTLHAPLFLGGSFGSGSAVATAAEAADGAGVRRTPNGRRFLRAPLHAW
jgi:hypothetical protein